MSKATGAVAWAVAIANNPAHGYDQANRWGPDYDCSSLVISAWESVGVAVREAGASYTGNMRGAFLACGFRDVTTQVSLANGIGLQPGDVLLNYASHTAMVAQTGRIVAARINEQGNATGGAPGDQTGREICLQTYYNYPWDCVLRYQEHAASAPGVAVIQDKPEGAVTAGENNSTAADSNVGRKQPEIQGLPTLRQGAKGETVRAAQILLAGLGFRCGSYGADGDFGPATEKAAKRFQYDRGLDQDGVIGPETWAALLGVA